jgi:hypothetical protein
MPQTGAARSSFLKYSGGKVNGTTKWLANRAMSGL